MIEQSHTFSLPQGSPCPDERRPQASTALTPAIDMPGKAERIVSHDSVPVLDTAKFEHMWRVATAIAASSPVPESLRKDGTNDLPQNVVIANCFKVVNQAVRWNMDPFALIDCASIIKGRLCWEGKVIAAVLESVAGIELDYTYEGTGELMKVKVIGTLPDGRTKEVEGDVGQWKTTRTGSPWSSPKDYKRQLAYRGAREWARRHKPAVMLGVYGSDEITPTGDVIDITPSPKPPAAPPPRRGGATQVRRVAHAPAQEQPIPETVVRAQKTPVGNAEPSPPQHSKPLPVKGKATKMTQFDWNSVEDLDEKQWLKDFKVDLDECRNKMMINAIVDRRQGTLDRLCEAGKKLSNEIIDHALSEIQS